MNKVFYKKLGIVIGGLSIVTATSVFVTLSLQTAPTNLKTNEFSPFTVTDTQIKETNYNVTTTDGKFQITDKNITVENPYTNISKAVFVRVKVVVTPKDKDNVFFYDEDNIIITEPNSDWVKGTDGLYYYKYVLKPGQTTSELFKDGNITLNIETPCNIEVIADTVQAEANNAKGVYVNTFAKSAWETLPNGVTNTAKP